MKKLIYVFAVAILTLTVVSFTTSENLDYPEDLPLEYVEVFKKDFINTFDNEDLRTTIETNFVSLFDEVTRIDAQYNDKSGYYYMVLGSQDGVERFEILKVNKADIENQTYTYLDLSTVDAATAQFCSSGPNFSPFPFVCTGPCQVRTTSCLGLICGVLIAGECID